MVWHGSEEGCLEWQVSPAHTMCESGASAINMLAMRATVLVLTSTLKSHAIVKRTFAELHTLFPNSSKGRLTLVPVTVLK